MNNILDQILDVSTTDSEELVLIHLEDDAIDPRLKLLSHSSRTTLHRCPRKHQLYRLSSTAISLEQEAEVAQGVTFSYGTAVGIGVQSVLVGKSKEQIYLDTFLGWNQADLLDVDEKGKKSFWFALFAVQKFISLRASGFLEEYELVYYTNKEGVLTPAIELSFQILLHNGFRYRGFVDAVLRHRTTGEILVLECKTSKYVPTSANYKNSGQALGYSVVLDIIFPELSSYTVLYLVYHSQSYEYHNLPFQKSLLQRALWLQELLIDMQIIELYESYQTYPMCGETCYDFFRDCEYLGLCTLDLEHLVKPLTSKIVEELDRDKEKYEFSIEFNDLVEAQLKKGEQ